MFWVAVAIYLASMIFVAHVLYEGLRRERYIGYGDVAVCAAFVISPVINTLVALLLGWLMLSGILKESESGNE